MDITPNATERDAREKEGRERILVTGASGFIGSFIVEEGLRQGYEVWAGVRRTSSRRFLKDKRIHFAELDMQDPAKLCAQLECLKAETGAGGWDYVVHAAGATKCLHTQDFFRTNFEGTRHLIDALQEADMVPRRFVFLSSLSVFGAIREEPARRPSADNPWIYTPIMLSDKPQPNTDYGRSKLAAEHYLVQQHGFPFTILRPTGVYGPRERDYFLMAQSISQHIDVAAGLSPQEITFVYVDDVVQAVFKSMKAPKAEGKAYFLSDGKVYSSRTYSDLVQQQLGNPWVLHVKLPLCLLRAVCWIGGKVSRLTGTMTALNGDKYHILSQRNWQCDIAPAIADFGYDPRWTLEQGVEASIRWYRAEGWL